MERTARHTVNTIVEVDGCDPVAGHVRWDPLHSLWNGAMLLIAGTIGPATFT